MLSRKNRFHGHAGVRRVYRLGKPTRMGAFSLYVHRYEKLDDFRLAVVVSKKVHKSAVKRNRIRRRLYELVRMEIPHMVQPFELVLTVYSPDVADMPADELKTSVMLLLRRAGVIGK